MQKIIKRLLRWALGIIALLIIPLVGTLTGSGIEGQGWYWTPFDFMWAFTVLFGAALMYELISRKLPLGIYRVAVAAAVLTGVLLVWVNAAVGIIGDGPINMIYLAVVAIGFLGGVIVRFQPRGLSRVMFVLAGVQLLIPVIVLIVWKQSISWLPGIVRVFFLNAFFAMAWTTAGLLFRQTAEVKQS